MHNPDDLEQIEVGPHAFHSYTMPKQLISIWVAIQAPASAVIPLQNKGPALPQKEPFFGVQLANWH